MECEVDIDFDYLLHKFFWTAVTECVVEFGLRVHKPKINEEKQECISQLIFARQKKFTWSYLEATLSRTKYNQFLFALYVHEKPD